MSSSPSTARSWFPTRQSAQRSRTSVGALVGLGAVADHVAEAPDLVDAGRLDVREHGLERGQVGVDVAESIARRIARARERRTIVGRDDFWPGARSIAVRVGGAAVAMVIVAELAVWVLSPRDPPPDPVAVSATATGSGGGSRGLSAQTASSATTTIATAAPPTRAAVEPASLIAAYDSPPSRALDAPGDALRHPLQPARARGRPRRLELGRRRRDLVPRRRRRLRRRSPTSARRSSASAARSAWSATTTSRRSTSSTSRPSRPPPRPPCAGRGAR